MDDQVIAKLCDALELTLSPDNQIRREAEKYVYDSMAMNGFCSAMLHISTDPKYREGRKVDVNQAAAIQFKNMAEFHWRFRDEAHAKDSCVAGARYIIIQAEDKDYVRNNILELILQCKNDTVVRQLNYAVECIVRTDFPEKWPGLATEIQGYLNSDSEDKILLGLESLKSVCKRYEYEYGVGRKPLDEIVDNLFPRLEELVGLVQENNSLEAFDIKYRIAELLYVVNQINICDRYRSQEGFGKLMNFYQYALECNIDENLLTKTEDTDTIVFRKHRPEWKLKSVAMHFLFRVFQKYGNPKLCDEDDKELSQNISKFLISSINSHNLN